MPDQEETSCGDQSSNEQDSAMQPSSTSTIERNQQWDAARFLLHCTTRFSMSYTAVDGVAALTEQLVEEVSGSLAKRISTVMDKHGVEIPYSLF